MKLTQTETETETRDTRFYTTLAVLKGGANESLKTDTPQEIDADALIQRYGE